MNATQNYRVFNSVRRDIDRRSQFWQVSDRLVQLSLSKAKLIIKNTEHTGSRMHSNQACREKHLARWQLDLVLHSYC
ncbi:MAG: hypothetical protein CLLPBCKN_008324 [Chroococcidiopsis cubana SAG 39.79]|nr:hypothetical protein [Chroococcidiopsis cubana SAG 39.79]